MLKLVFDDFPTIETESLFLRSLKDTDAPEIHHMRSNLQVNKFLNRKISNSIDDALLFIHHRNLEFKGKENIYWAITEKKEDLLIGTICLYKFSQVKKAVEIGYELNPIHQRKGIMKEAIQSVLKFAFINLDCKIVYAMTIEENLRSVQILEANNFKRDLNYKLSNEEIKEQLIVYHLKLDEFVK